MADPLHYCGKKEALCNDEIDPGQEEFPRFFLAQLCQVR
jgi:hypothetical protein